MSKNDVLCNAATRAVEVIHNRCCNSQIADRRREESESTAELHHVGQSIGVDEEINTGH